MADCLRLAIIDSHPMFRKGLIDTVSSERMAVVAEGESADDAMHILANIDADILIIGLSISGDSLGVAEKIMRTHKDLKVAILTDSNDEADVVDAIRSGIQGYILKGVTGPELLSALEIIASGQPYITPALASRLLMITRGKPALADRTCELGLSLRDKWVLRHLTKGLSNEQLALELGVTVRTVKYYLSQIFRKLRVRSRSEAIVKAQKIGLN
jgi:two-component system, NarL family, nitrate/nitrite response regulator NarL